MRSESPETSNAGSGGWRYDSFLLRLWHVSRGQRIRRVELQHLQTGLVERAVDPEPGWVLDSILDALRGGDEDGAE